MEVRKDVMGELQVEELEALFDACDLNLSGFIEKDELEILCADLQLTEEEFGEIFRALDTDGDGQISKTDFKEGFRSVSGLLLRKKGNSPSGSPLLRARTFSFENEVDLNREDEGEEKCMSIGSNPSCRSTASTKSNRSGKSGPTASVGSGRSTPRKRTVQQIKAASLENNLEEFERLLTNLDSGYHQLNNVRYIQIILSDHSSSRVPSLFPVVSPAIVADAALVWHLKRN